MLMKIHCPVDDISTHIYRERFFQIIVLSHHVHYLSLEQWALFDKVGVPALTVAHSIVSSSN